MNIEEFANYVEVAITADETGRERQLHAAFRYQGPDGQCHQAAKVVDLDPYIERVHHELAKYHHQLHGEDPTTNPEVMASGWFDSVVNIAKSVANSDAVQSVYHTVTQNPIARGAIGMLPGGGAMLTAVDEAKAVMTKAQAVVNSAVQGDHAALAKVAAVKQLAAQGHPEAQHVVTVMQAHLQVLATGGRAPGRSRDHRTFYDRGLGRGAPAVSSPLAAGGVPLDGHVRTHAHENKVWKGDHWERPHTAGATEHTAGWFYNVPYRGSVEYMLDPTHAPAIAARALYQSGIKHS